MTLTDFFDMPVVDESSEKRKFIDHMNALRDMTNQEYTLYKKWVEVQEYRDYVHKSMLVKANIWQPETVSLEGVGIELLNLKPKVIFVHPSDKELTEKWLLFRIFTHTMSFEQNPGRFLRFFVIDENTGKYLGCASLGSDVMAITVRDKWIGWNDEHKMKLGKLRHSAIATTITGVQPFGYNFLGGKLIASMLTTAPVRDAWKEMYNEELVGITTTSLYGVHSMYQRIPFWKELGETTGKIMLKPDDKFYEFWHHHIKNRYADKYADKVRGGGSGPATGIKQKILVMIMKELGMKQSTYQHGFKRGVFYSEFYSNTREYLRNEITDDQLILNPKIKNGVKDVMAWWVPKAHTRYTTLLEQNRLSNDVLFYNDAIGMSWDEMKSKYLVEVGR
jgi:hypothetical protein